MNKRIQEILDQIKKIWEKLSNIQRIIFFSVIGVFVLAVILLIIFSSAPSRVPLIGVPIEDDLVMTKIITRLDEEIPGKYEVRPDNIILVEDDKTARYMRTILVREDLIPKETDPWAIFDVERWTETDIHLDVNKLRAITGSLEQHLLAIEDVDAVEVIVDIPPTELFEEDQKQITASIQITPKPNSDIRENRKKIEGIEKLVLLAISGLEQENVVITDQYGIILNDFIGLEDFDRLKRAEEELEIKRKQEIYYEARILESLSKWFTRERVEILKCELDLDMSKETSQTTEIFPIITTEDNPDTPFSEEDSELSVLTDELTQKRDWQGTGFIPEGPPGLEGQTSPEYQEMSDFTGHLTESSEESHYKVNERQTEREERPWKINKISVSVAIDGRWQRVYDEEGKLVINKDGSIEREYIPVSDEDLAKITELVEGAIGFDKARGDIVVVEHIQKDRTDQFKAEDDKIRQERFIGELVGWILAGIGIILLAIVIFRVIQRYIERKRQEKEEELARQHQAMREAALRTAEEAGMEVELSIEERARLEMQENAVNMAREHPEDVAQLIRTWLMEE
jgi:flagellar M-ring protein FliF